MKHKIKTRLWYWKTVIMLAKLNLLIKIFPPNIEEIEQIIETLETLKVRLGEVD